ncbi:replication termination factor 2 isoform X2 [Hyla sarda]|uniref:replication termination factor 2 isoform X2 n=1 Tax=Hyla sarda TaxID=327740 RepID=UPI0024C3F12A|nr:replication termination factor 2 isoform X2 [Hyla sarda]
MTSHKAPHDAGSGSSSVLRAKFVVDEDISEMGCDGGTIPKRHELVKGPKKVEKVDKNAELVARWYYCILSQEKLKRPIVTCELGRLYNKDAVIEFILDKSPDKPNAESAAHIKSIKNVIELNLTDNPAWTGGKGNTKGDTYDEQRAQFICPVVGLEMNGKHRFCVLRQCGCVFSERAIKEIKTDICHKCGKNFNEDDIILLNGDKNEVEELRKKMDERRLKAKLEKKSKKTKPAEIVTANNHTEEEAAGPSGITNGSKTISREKINFVSSTTSTEPNSSETVVSSSSAAKRQFPSTNNKSEAYKSIFTSHSSAKRTKDQSSNWVTHTAYYF